MSKDLTTRIFQYIRMRLWRDREDVWQRLREETGVQMTLEAFIAMEEGQKTIPESFIVAWCEVFGVGVDEIYREVKKMERRRELDKGKSDQEIARELYNDIKFHLYKMEQEKKEGDEEKEEGRHD